MVRFSPETQTVHVCETISIARPAWAIHQFVADARNAPRYVSQVLGVRLASRHPEVWSVELVYLPVGPHLWTARMASAVADREIEWSASGPGRESVSVFAAVRSIDNANAEVTVTVNYFCHADSLARRLLATFRPALLRRALRIALLRLKRILELTWELSRPWPLEASSDLRWETHRSAHAESLADTSDVDVVDVWTRRLLHASVD